MTTLNTFDRQCLADMLQREGIAAVLSELAWLQAETDLTKLLAEPPANAPGRIDALCPAYMHRIDADDAQR
jgi:hypothetical protein